MATTTASFPPSPLPRSPAGSAPSSANHAQQQQKQQQQQQHNNVSYEKFAPRSSSQVSRLSRLAALTAGPTARAVAREDEDRLQQQQQQLRPNNYRHNNFIRSFLMEAMSPPVIPEDQIESETNNNQSHSDNLPAPSTLVKQTLQQALKTSDHLTQQLKHTTSLRLALRASINIAEDISNRHADLIRHSGELSAAADRLQEEEALLTRHAEEIGMPLKHYDAVDRIGVLVGVLFKGKTTVRGLAKVKVDNDDYPALLDEIDDAVEFFGRECGGKEVLQAELKKAGDKQQQLTSGSLEYFRRALALQDAALYLIKEAVAERIQTTTAQIVGILNLNKVPVAADKLEASLIYTRFHGISSRSNRLIGLLRARLHHGEVYHELLQLCRNTYCTNRESLLRLTVRAHMDKLKELHGPVGMTRLASVFLVRLCTVETSMYLDFFGDKKKLAESTEDRKKSGGGGAQLMSDDGTFYDSEFQQYLQSLCGSLHRTVRSSLVTMNDLDTLCQIVTVLREERSMASSSPTTMAAARAISSVIEDAQERLIFCANKVLTKEVVRFKAVPSDLDYPDKLVKKTETAIDQTASDEDDEAVLKQLEQVYESWFPPVRSVLRILSKIFRVVEPRVFEDIALQSVQACTRCLKDGAVYIQRRRGIMHSDLFLVRHLLILREQLSPFDIELRSVEKQLDFSEAGKAVARFLANRNRRLFSMSTENALLTLLREGVSVQESSVDSKRDLEDALRSACNDFIEHTSASAAGDLLDTVAKIKNAEEGSLAQQAMLRGDVLEILVSKSKTNVETKLAEIATQMKLYLDNPGTQSILLKPISRKINRAVEDMRKLVAQCPDGELEWDDEKRQAVTAGLDEIEQLSKKATKVAK